MITILIVLALLAQPAPPPPRARWDGSGAALVTWHQTARGCLWSDAVFVGCWDGAGAKRVTLGRVGPLDGQLRPTARTVYRVVVDGVAHDVPLRTVLLLPVFRA